MVFRRQGSRRSQGTTPDLSPSIADRDGDPNESTSLLFVTAPHPTLESLSPFHPLHRIRQPLPEYTAIPIEEDAEPPADQSTKDKPRNKRASWLSVLILPGRIAVGALSFLAGFGLSKQCNASRGTVWASGCVSLVVGQILVSVALRHSRRRAEEADKMVEETEEERMAWFDAIQAVGKIVDTFTDGLQAPSAVKHIFLDTSLTRMLHDSTSKNFMRNAVRGQASPNDALLLGRYYLDYALATYGFMLLKLLDVMDPTYNMLTEGTRGVDVAKYMLRLRTDQILVSKLDGEAINVPRHFVAVDEEVKAVVIAIRGTNSVSDIITDLLCGNEPFAEGYAHGGMKDAAEALYTSVLPFLRSSLAEHPSYSIAVTGHSLGAGVAILLTKVLLMNGFTDVKCYAIAPCPVFGPMHRVDSDWSDALECFIHADDLVAKLCLASARNLALDMERMDSLTLTARDKKDIIRKEDIHRLESMLQRDRAVSPDPREDHVEQLYIPSHHGVHWLLPLEEGEEVERDWPLAGEDTREEYVGPAYMPSKHYQSFVVRPRLFERILVTKGCVSAHFPSSYTAAFAGLDIPPRIVRPPPPPSLGFAQPWYDGELGSV